MGRDAVKVTIPLEVEATHRRKWMRIRWILIAGIMAVCSLPCDIFLWQYIWPPFRLSLSLRVYSDAQEVSSAFTFLDTNTGYSVLYYWTSDPLEAVQRYYEKFTLPLIEGRTVFLPYGDEMETDNIENRLCDYDQKFSCLEVTVIDFGQSEFVSLPNVISDKGFDHTSTPSPLSSDIIGGTLIIYSYYTDEW